MKNYIAIPAIVAALAIGGTTTAVAGDLITSRDIKNNSVRSVDVKDGTIKFKDLHPKLQAMLVKSARDGKDGQPGKDGSVAGVQTNWVGNTGVTIINASTVRLDSEASNAGLSLEILDLNLPVQATKTIEFTYRLEGGAVYGAGSPRVFVEINGSYENTHDANPSDAGVDNGDGTFTKSYTIAKNGRVGAAGVVYDNPAGVGAITISDLKISGHAIKFQ